MLQSLRDTCIEELGRVFSEDWMARCKDFIEVRREKHHLKTLRRPKDKFKRLLYKKQEKEGEHTRMHGVNIGLYSNTTMQNNTCCTHVESGENCPLNNKWDQDEKKERKENIWVKNLSSTTLTKDQIKALAHRPNYAIVPRSPPVGEYIIAIENACNQLQQGKVEELRGEIKSVLKNIHTPRSNITREERRAIDELGRDKSKMILTVDKGVSMVVMDRDDYNHKAQALQQESAYRPIPNDPTNKYKTRIIALLNSIKTEGGINEATYKKLYHTGVGSPKFYGLPKIHKEGTPLRPIVSSIWAVTYSTSKEVIKDPQASSGKISTPHLQ